MQCNLETAIKSAEQPKQQHIATYLSEKNKQIRLKIATRSEVG